MHDALPIASRIDAGRLRRHVEHVASTLPTRLAGTAAGEAMARYSAEQLAQAGAAGRVVETPGLVSVPQAGALHVDGEREAIAAQTCAHAAPTPAQGLGAEMVYAGGGSEEDLRQAGAAGKIVLLDLAQGPARPEKHRLALRAGAVGMVTFNWGPADGNELPYGTVKGVWGNPTPALRAEAEAALPAIGIGRRDGLRLRERLAQGALPARLHAASDNGWRTVHYTVGEIAGASEAFVLVGGHQDSWAGPSATDNATGSACIVELAHLFAGHAGQLRRGLRFALWEGHETGGMLSSAAYADRHWDSLRDHAVAYLQIDQPGCRGATQWGAHSNTPLRQFQQEVDVAVLGDQRSRRWRRSTKIGDASFIGLGVPMFASLAAYPEAVLREHPGAPFGWWHHTTANTLDKVDFDDLATHVRVYAAYLWRLCTLPVLPWDFGELVRALHARLQALAEAGDDFELLPIARRCERLAALADGLRARVQACNADFDAGRPWPEQAVDALNAVQTRLCGTLLGIECSAAGRYEHDPYGLTAQNTVLPALYGIPAAKALAPGPERWMAETELRRHRNRVSDAIETAIETAAPLIEAGAPSPARP